ncbi:hypothetical protein M406DRAFT_295096 [Cryphonectria parasitica EP155]|uniref:Copper-fist domain-containing protein n=1 Tax=Cryphonectria parasitica (strain ATCC 38755 / EP155) TaxID=660469 RepID=A0A9P5CKS6_CRYP1|nr:uncharacterized protein M406DRAFT_295096 [Cryphonectria parasitica EP155]KAF3761477.1 hypothetical protein M406DRAFT_295096 [Cryphonectria parasitica EP155]
MIIDGEKWACESCVRGHRVSNCTHADRPLQHINKKGRPVSQCQHCRSQRRSKSAHVKCDCGEKTSKCVHLQPTLEGHRDSCCCNHGGRCTCSHKKEQPHLDTVPESDSDQETTSSSSTKPSSKIVRNRRSRASTQNSDGMLQFDENGHHKPTYKHAKPHQTSGPYQLTRGHSAQGADSGCNRSMEDLANSPSSAETGSMPQAQDQRLTKSETASPLMTGSSVAQSSTSLPPLDLSSVQGWPSFTSSGFDMFGNMDDLEPPIVSAGLSAASVDWGQYGLGFDSKDVGSFAPSSYSQAPSFGGFDQPSTMTSGDVSEVEDLVPSAADDYDPMGTFSRTNTSSSGFSFRPSQENLAGSVGLSSSDFDFNKINKELDGEKYYDSAVPLINEDPSIAATITTQEMSGFVQDDPIFWQMREGDLDYTNPLLVPDASVPNFWSTA